MLCFGLKETEEGFINMYTCHPPACTGDADLSERNKNKNDVFVYMLFPGLCLLFTAFYVFFYFYFFPPVVAGIFIQNIPAFSLSSSGITKVNKFVPTFCKNKSMSMNFPFGIPIGC